MEEIKNINLAQFIYFSESCNISLNHHRLLNARPMTFDDRYSKDFTEEEIIGQGGFGMVARARHIVDGCLYAVKKINMRFVTNYVNRKDIFYLYMYY